MIFIRSQDSKLFEKTHHLQFNFKLLFYSLYLATLCATTCIYFVNPGFVQEPLDCELCKKKYGAPCFTLKRLF